jgi:hypothetical protein
MPPVIGFPLQAIRREAMVACSVLSLLPRGVLMELFILIVVHVRCQNNPRSKSQKSSVPLAPRLGRLAVGTPATVTCPSWSLSRIFNS